ncbi:unnamed protein product [Paramecium sonneborni]|uniref:WD40-repeat-containing domain n=1 Tax=Paramecium sonneborni TaxID=65129 RepID=A0A8S1P1R4_9CILI|nr:unnamed protein product [Paramecium sonneborni]
MLINCTQASHQDQKIIGFCIDSSCLSQRPYCHFCLISHCHHLNKLTTQELLSEWMKERILTVQNVQKNVQECKIALDNLINVFFPYSKFSMESFSELGISQIDQLIKSICQIEDCEEKLFKQLQESIEQIKQIVNEILKKIKSRTNINENNKQISNNSVDQQNLEQPNNQFKQKPNLNPFTFDLIKENSIKQHQWCGAITFNKDSSIVAAGCVKDIKVFLNLRGKLNQIQLLSEHAKDVCTLKFMKNTNNFVSGSDDNLIIIWQAIENNQWKIYQKLNGHQNRIYCILLNKADDQIISSSQDKTIKFWMGQSQWSCQQTITDHSHYIYSLSLNEQSNKLISCSQDQQILIMEQQNLDKLWFVIQKIKLSQLGYRLCFINDDQFTFQPFSKDQMHVYEMDRDNQQFRKTKEVAVKCGQNIDYYLFPQQYLQSKCLLVNKNSKNVNLIRKNENGDFIIQQSIEFGTYQIFGQLSDDGEYLITWDNESKEIQIRKCREL